MRVPNWELKLYSVLSEVQTRTFELGKFDCAIFAAECIQACTGINYIKKFLNYYNVYTNGIENIDTGRSLCDLVTETLDCRPSLVHQLQRGDPVLFETTDNYALGICDGENALFVTEKGLREIPMRKCVLGWKT